jgi:hypothetical protein
MHARQHQHRLTEQGVRQLVADYRAGAGIKQPTGRYGIHRTTVAEHFKRAGVEIRHRGLLPEQVDEATRLYLSGWSLVRVGDQLGCDAETIRQALRRNGAVLRRPWEHPT